MIASDFKIAVRNILRNKVHSSISILGLGIGLGSIIVLIALIIHETSFDRFIPDYQNVYRITFNPYCVTSYPLPEEMKKDFPEVKDFFRINQANNIQVRNLKGESGNNQEFAFSDPSIYKILGIKLIAGMPAKSLSEVAISEKTAMKFFGNTSPLGEILRVKLNNDFIPLSVSGVYKNFPANSTLYPDYIADTKLVEVLIGQFTSSLGEYGSAVSTSLTWNMTIFYTYLVLDKNCDIQSLVSKMQKYREMFGYDELKKIKYDLQPVCDIYLGSADYLNGYRAFRAGNANELKYYWSISFLILIISMTNYIFLTRGSTSGRLSELGTRKVLGASPGILRRQIILESNLITLLSLIPASFVIDSGMNLINNTMNRTLTLEVFSNPLMWVLLILVVIFTGTVSGLLIAYKISRTQTLVLLSGKSSEKSRSKKWDYSFLILHFTMYLILVVSVMTVTKQIKFSMTNIKGIDPRNVLVSWLKSPGLKASFTAICSEMEKIPGVKKAAGSSFIPFFSPYIPVTMKNAQGEAERFDGLIMGEGMTEVLSMEIVDGSPLGAFKPGPSDVLFNESSAKKYNVKAGDLYLKDFHVKGIVKDFNSHSLHTLIQPMIIVQQNPDKMELLVIKTDGKNDKAVINRLRELYNEIAPDEIFEVSYLTDSISDIYNSEKSQAKLMGAFSLLATVLAIMGLFGIALISIGRKTKEIGLRKVNGASVFEVIYLINKDFVRWVLLSILIGLPVAFYLMSQWLKRFAYKTDLNWWLFAIAGISAILIAVMTVSWQSWRAASRNPVEALRYE
jgi:putative ABC transport system permease protein